MTTISIFILYGTNLDHKNVVSQLEILHCQQQQKSMQLFKKEMKEDCNEVRIWLGVFVYTDNCIMIMIILKAILTTISEYI